MLIFLDVGTHDGHTLEEVTKSIYKFDLIYGFEPMPKQFNHVSDRFGMTSNLTLLNFGLSNISGTVNIYGDNENLGASIFAEKNDTDENIVTECKVVEASKFFSDYLSEEDTIIMKLNCEGAEIPILNNLIDTGEINKVANVMIDFDIRKVTGMEHEEGKLLDRLNSMGFDRYSLCDQVMHGQTHQDRINNWLRSIDVNVFV